MSQNPYDRPQLIALFKTLSREGATDGPNPDPCSSLEHLLDRANVFCSSLDYQTGQYRYLSAGLKRLLGYTPGLGRMSSVDEVLCRHYQEDREVLRQIHETITLVLSELPAKSWNNLSFSYTCRMHTIDNRVLWFSHHSVIVESDSSGAPLRDFTVAADISPFASNLNCTLCINESTSHGEVPLRTLVLMPPLETDFSPRELEVLRLVAIGRTSQQIANQLNISFHTVCSHRKNLLRKAGVESTIHLITAARQSGHLA